MPKNEPMRRSEPRVYRVTVRGEVPADIVERVSAAWATAIRVGPPRQQEKPNP